MTRPAADPQPCPQTWTEGPFRSSAREPYRLRDRCPSCGRLGVPTPSGVRLHP